MSSNNLSIRTKRARSPSAEEDDSNKRARTEHNALPIRPRTQTRQPLSENDASTMDSPANNSANTSADTAAANVHTAPVQSTGYTTATQPTNDASVITNGTSTSTSADPPIVDPLAPPIPTAAQLNTALATLHAQDALEAFTLVGPAQQQQEEFLVPSRPLDERITRPNSSPEADDEVENEDGKGEATADEDDDDEADDESSSSEPEHEPDSDDSYADDHYIGDVSRSLRYADEEAVAEAAGADTADRDEASVWAGLGSFAG